MFDRGERVSFLNTLGEVQLGYVDDYIDEETYKVRLDNWQIHSVKHENLAVEDEEPVDRWQKHKIIVKKVWVWFLFVLVLSGAYVAATYKPEQTQLQKDTEELNQLNTDSVYYIEQCGKLKEADDKKKEILWRINILKPIFPWNTQE